MPFLRFSRDKRGYENVYLVHTQNRRGKPSRPRVLYWYRTPPGIKVGRPPFDEEARRRLEAQNPDVTFDWPTIIATPMPPPAEHEQWRERRRAERAAKQAQRAEDAAEQSERSSASAEQPGPMEPDELAAGDELLASFTATLHEPEPVEVDAPNELPSPVDSPAETPAAPSQVVGSQPPGDQMRDPAARRRRRRGGRRRRGTQAQDSPANQSTPDGGNPGAATAGAHGSSETFPDSAPDETIESTDE